MGTPRVEKENARQATGSVVDDLAANTLAYWQLSLTYRTPAVEAMTVEQALHALRDILTSTSSNRPLAVVAGSMRDKIVTGDGT